MAGLKVEAIGISDVGMKREKNEDAYLLRDDLGLYLVADGMGGHAGGEFASQIAVKTIEETIKNYPKYREEVTITGTPGEPEPFQMLNCAIQRACKKIHEKSLEDPDLRGMGTTIVATLVNDENLWLAHVGDSRAYLIRDRNIQQLTEDHSLVHEQVKAGLLSAEEAKTHKLKNIITRSVGFQEEVEADLFNMTIKPGDLFLICSDGLTSLVEDEEIKEVLLSHDPKVAIRKLVQMSNERGGDDNITILILHFN